MRYLTGRAQKCVREKIESSIALKLSGGICSGLTLAAADAKIWGGWWFVVGRGGRAGERVAPRARLSSNR
jgi:hypothetical protein